MYLKKIEINNYRQLQNVTLDFQRNLTVLAGPNNSGKTTLISVLKGVFHDKNFKLSYSDIPTHLSVAWIDKVFSLFQTIILNNDRENGVTQIIKELSTDDHFKDDFIISKFDVKIQVDYSQGNDEIQNFADYIMDLLSNRKYIGEYKYNDIVIPDAVPAIISPDLFERVQRRLAKNKHAPARHKAEDDYLLTTKLFCGKCGAYMVGEAGTARNKSVHRYYKCVNAKKHTCDKKTVRKEWIEELAVQKALEILTDEVLVDYLVDRIFDLQTDENPRLPRLHEQLADVEKRIGNIVQAIEQGIIFESTKERLAQLEKEKSELDITILQEQIKKPFLTKDQILFGIEKFKKLDISTKEGKQRLIDGFINAIYLYDDKITFTFNYKDGTKTVFLSELNCTPSGSDLKCFTAPSLNSLNFFTVGKKFGLFCFIEEFDRFSP